MMAVALPRPAAWRLLANLAAFQASWFACVLLAGRGQALAAAAAALAAVVLHFAWSDARRADAWLTLAAVALGVMFDSALALGGIVDYAAANLAAGAAPLWILALWALFAATLRQPLRWLHGRPLLAALFGGVGGPFSYAAAARLGACSFPDRPVALAALAVGWALVTPLLVELARRLDRGARA